MLTYGIDWDDVISDLNTHAIQLANGEHGLDLKLEDINSWENVGKASVIKQYYQDERIYRMQTVTDEARNFIHELQKKGKVYIITAIAPQFMSLRAKQILTAFPDFQTRTKVCTMHLLPGMATQPFRLLLAWHGPKSCIMSRGLLWQ